MASLLFFSLIEITNLKIMQDFDAAPYAMPRLTGSLVMLLV
jgi:hypothetical protein